MAREIGHGGDRGDRDAAGCASRSGGDDSIAAGDGDGGRDGGGCAPASSGGRSGGDGVDKPPLILELCGLRLPLPYFR